METKTTHKQTRMVKELEIQALEPRVVPVCPPAQFYAHANEMAVAKSIARADEITCKL